MELGEKAKEESAAEVQRIGQMLIIELNADPTVISPTKQKVA